MFPEKLRKGDTIGIVSPSSIAQHDDIMLKVSALESLGFSVKLGKNIYKDTYGYLASEEERAEDFNAMVADASVKLIFFGGGYGGEELLPLIDYENIKNNPKIFLSYSDGTSILNAIYAKVRLVTYYGQTPGVFEDLRYYDYKQFSSHLVAGDAHVFRRNSQWRIMHGGISRGLLIGGYTVNFALMLNGDYFNFDSNQKYILFLEDHERYSNVANVSMLISHIEQSKFINNISGLLFGHYSHPANEELLGRLRRFGRKHDVPVVYCDDFGHGVNHAIMPIGQPAELNADDCRLTFLK